MEARIGEYKTNPIKIFSHIIISHQIHRLVIFMYMPFTKTSEQGAYVPLPRYLTLHCGGDCVIMAGVYVFRVRNVLGTQHLFCLLLQHLFGLLKCVQIIT